ncbi:MAG: FadR family transcriptional regulator [Thalassovita sp.]
MAQFQEIRRHGHLPDLIAGQILQQVTDGELQPGDPLPTETALAEIFGVSRNVVREAIARLRSDGVIETKQGRGAVVQPLSERATFRIDIASLGDQDNLASLFELRGLLEIDAAGLAALRRNDADVAELGAAIDIMRGSQDFDDQRLEADARFHRRIGLATGNGYLATIIDYISSRLVDTTRATGEVYAKSDLMDVTIREHSNILDAIRAQDVQAARLAMATHIRGAAARLAVDLPDTE